MDAKARMDKFFSTCDALHDMVKPLGSVSANQYERLLSVAKQYRKLATKLTTSGDADKGIRIPKSKTVIELEVRHVDEFIRDGFYDVANQYLEDLEKKYGFGHRYVGALRHKLNMLWYPSDAD